MINLIIEQQQLYDKSACLSTQYTVIIRVIKDNMCAVCYDWNYVGKQIVRVGNFPDMTSDVEFDIITLSWESNYLASCKSQT